MATSDALYVVEDWISEHYFTSDDKSGTFAARAKTLVDEWRSTAEDEPSWRSPRERFTSGRTELVSRLLDLQADAAALETKSDSDARRELLGARSTAMADILRAILGYTTEEATSERWDVSRTGPLRRFATRGVDDAPLAMLDALAADDVEDVLSKSAGHLPQDVVLDAGTEQERTLTTVPQVLSALALDAQAPEFMLVLAGRFAVLTSADLWPQGRYLVADVQTIAERADLKRGGEVERMLACLSADSLAPDANSQIWWTTTREQAVNNAVGVSEDLRDGVRESIEIIANEVLERRRVKGFEELADSQAQQLALEALRYLYRILFLLYAEASPELGVLPVGAPEYQNGYSVDRLRDLTQREVPIESADGTYLYESLALLFRLVNSGHLATDRGETSDAADHGSGTLSFESLEADLFDPKRTALIDEVGIGNAALQRVLENLLLSKEKKGHNRGFISYVALGINQLGAVYESLMSYTGSFAQQELVEVARNGEAKNGSWVVPLERVDDSMQAHLVMVEDEVGQKVPRTYRHGEFVFRLSGRARQQSASYYSPEVITSFTVSQGLAELLDPVITDETDLPEGAEIFDDEDFDHEPIRRRRTTAVEILEMSICEPALGSGAFAIEAVRQLATEYLTRRQVELGERIDPEQYATELQRVKAYIALHNVYGVDLNPTAVELAEVSLWLDTMAPGLKAPWFGLRLRAGNSLIGARHAVYTAQALTSARLKSVIESAPEALPVTTVHEDPVAEEKRSSVSGKVFHFLLPGEGWLAAASDTEIKKLAPDAAKALRDHAKGYVSKLTKPQVKRLEVLTQRVEELWGLALRRIAEAEAQSRRAIPVWGAATREGGEVTRKQIEASLEDANSAYRRLRLVMDAWCALWFWPVLPDDEIAPPTVEEWISTLEQILGRSLGVVKHGNSKKDQDPGERQLVMGTAASWYELDTIEVMFSAGGAANIDTLLHSTPWLRRSTEIAAEQRFFHWELDFAAAFDRGGFDLQVGNPPWVAPSTPMTLLFAEYDPWWSIENKKDPQLETARREAIESDLEALAGVIAFRVISASTAAYLNARSMYPVTEGAAGDLYPAFISIAWQHQNYIGVVALVHPAGHLSAKPTLRMRIESYSRLRRLWSFRNEEKLFREIGNTRPYAVNIYGAPGSIDFMFSYPVFLPATVTQSLVHDGSGGAPFAIGEDGHRNTRPHRGRIGLVRASTLRAIHEVVEGGDAEVPMLAPRLPSSVDAITTRFYSAIAPDLGSSLSGAIASRGYGESVDVRSKRLARDWGQPVDWSSLIAQGPNMTILNPAFQDRKPAMKSHRDYQAIDLLEVVGGRIPVTEYKPLARDGGELANRQAVPGNAESRFSLFWRRRVDPTGMRTLQAAIFPPGASHVDQVHSVSSNDKKALTDLAASASTLISDFYIRSVIKGDIYSDNIARLPLGREDDVTGSAMRLRVLRLNCVHSSFAALWSDVNPGIAPELNWLFEPRWRMAENLTVASSRWRPEVGLTRDEARRQALLEIDVLFALAIGIDIDLLIDIYRVHFGTLWKYDRGLGASAYIFDANGNILPSAVRTAWNKAGRPETGLPIEDRTAVHPSVTGTGRTIVYEQPFRILDREADMRRAYAEFQRRMGN